MSRKQIKFEDLKLTPKEMKELAEGARRFVYVDELNPTFIKMQREELAAADAELASLTAAAGEDTV